MAADGPSGGRGRVRVGLVVVHGVGETEPGYCVNAVLDTLAATRPGYSVSPANEYTRVPDPDSGKPATQVFPVIRRGAAHNSGVEIEAVELHWADLSASQPGRVNTLLQLFRVIFESHHLVDAMLDRTRDVTAWVLRRLLWLAGWLLRGPSAALTIVTSVICALFLFEPAALSAQVMDVRSQVLVVTGAIFIASLYLFYRIARQQDYSWYDTIVWLAITSLAVFVLTFDDALLGLLRHVPDLKIGPQRFAAPQVADCPAGSVGPACYIDGLYKIIVWGWRFWGVLLLVATLLFAITYVRARITRDRSRLGTLSTSIAILIMQFLLWTTVVVSAIYPILNQAETISTLKDAQPIIRNAITARQLDPLSPVVKLFQVPNIELDWIGRFKFIYASAAFTVLLLIVVGFGLIELRQWKARRGLNDLEQTARSMPRLLFNPVLVGLLIFSYLVVFALVFIQPYIDKNQMFVTLRGYILPVAAVVAVTLPFFFGRRVANVVNFARDLIDHHYRPRQETAAYVIPSMFRLRHRRLRRERIQRRLDVVLEHFVQNQGYDGVIFLAHSQGSIIVYDYLRDNGPAYTRLGDAAPALLTFGSPLGSIYQKYFHEYAASKAVPLGFTGRLKCWINLYRVDDYIGGRIWPPPGLRVDNHVMGLGGHTGYWTEPDVAEALDAILTGKVADATKPPPLPPPPMTPSASYAVRDMRRA